jgi:hypothetical protein
LIEFRVFLSEEANETDASFVESFNFLSQQSLSVWFVVFCLQAYKDYNPFPAPWKVRDRLFSLAFAAFVELISSFRDVLSVQLLACTYSASFRIGNGPSHRT